MRLCLVCLVCLLSLTRICAAESLQQNQSASSNGLQIVTLRPDADLDELLQEYKLIPRHTFRHALNGFAAGLGPAAAKQLRKDGRVLAVEPEGRARLAEQTIPAGVLRMGISNFPVSHITGQDHRIGVDVAVLDTGIQTNHPDLNVVQGVDCTGSGLNGDDWHGHGTMMAGIIGALDNNFGVVGVAPGARLWAVQVFGPGTNFGSWGPILAGMDYIATNADKIAVVNASFTDSGAGTPYAAIRQAVSNLVSRGVVFVAAAGNDTAPIEGGDGIFGTDDDIVPAALSEVMAVSAIDPANDTFTYFSNFSRTPKSPIYVSSPGAGIDLAAPGLNILSTIPGSSYYEGSGTSEACAHATGLVALYLAANGRATNAQGVFAARQTLINYSQSQSQWHPPCGTNSPCCCPLDPDTNPEPLAFPSENWVPLPNAFNTSMAAQGFQFSFSIVPGYSYSVVQADSLGRTNRWLPLASTNGSSQLSTVTVLDQTPHPSHFYRVVRTVTP